MNQAPHPPPGVRFFPSPTYLVSSATEIGMDFHAAAQLLDLDERILRRAIEERHEEAILGESGGLHGPCASPCWTIALSGGPEHGR